MATPLIWACILVSLIGFALIANAQESNLTFSGLFDMTMTTTPITPISLTSTAINLVLGWGEASAQLDARLSNATFDTLTLSAAAPLGDINLNSSLKFNPSTVSFISWQSGATFTLLDMSFSNVTSVVDPQSNSYTQWSVTGTTNEVGLQGSIKLGICPLEFWEASVCGNWVWLDCFANMSVCVQFDDVNGFRNITTTMTDLILFEDILGIQGTLNTSIVFSANEKVLTPTLRFTPSWFFCSDIELLGELSVAPPLTIQSLDFYGIRGQCDMGNCVIFTFADSLDDAKNSSITGKAEYFERLGVTGCLPSCCGSDGSFEVNAYFER
ncbi:hypothetical protein KAH43_06370, partial [Candidatus Bipolaricaulota bacterium]|nr:hypothetical protein [Candidatus Bipolaricaulota bacterium]